MNIPAFELDKESNLPLWVQLRNRVVYLIVSGYYKPGDKLPTTRRFASELKIAYNTVSKAYMGLERDGYVKTVHGSGVFVADSDDMLGSSEQLEALAREFIGNCAEEGLTPSDAVKLVQLCAKKMERADDED